MKIDIDKEHYEEFQRAVNINQITHLRHYVQNNRDYLQFSKPQYAALIQYLNLSLEYCRSLQTNELLEYGDEFQRNFIKLFMDHDQIGPGKVLIKCENEYNFDVNLDKFSGFLENIKMKNMRLVDRLAEDIKVQNMLGGYQRHFGYVELEPAIVDGKSLGICVKDEEGYYWSLEEMKELAHEILALTQNEKNQEVIDARNSKLYDQKEYEKEVYKKREAEREAKIAEYKPTSGLLFLFQVFPSGLYRFSYTAKSSKERKIDLLKQQFGDNVNIIHCVEANDIHSFYHQFVKKQYKSRLVKDGSYKLEADDIEFFKNEQYPPQAMDWMNG